MGFNENTAMRQVMMFMELHRQKDKERQSKTEENVDGRPVGAPRAGVRWSGLSTCAPGSGPRIAFERDVGLY